MKKDNKLTDDLICFLNPLCKLKIKEPFTQKNMTSTEKKSALLGALLYVVLIVLFQILPVMLIAVNCNPDSPVIYGIVSFLFPNIYLLQHAIRKYINHEKGYCGNK